MPYQKRANYEPLNIARKIEVIENFRDYKKILFLRPFMNTYIGFLDDVFFGFTVEEKDISKWGMDAKTAIAYYLDHFFFRDPVSEFNYFNLNPEYKAAVNSLLLKKGVRKP